MNLFPYVHADKILDLNGNEPAQNLLALLRDCSREVVLKLQKKIADGKNTIKEGPGFTKSDLYEKCHSMVLGKDDSGVTPNPYLRYPELLFLKWEDFQGKHTTLGEKREKSGSLLELVSQEPSGSPKLKILKLLIFVSNSIPNMFKKLLREVVEIRKKDGLNEAFQHAETVPPFPQKLDDAEITLSNYNVALALILSDPQPLQKMDIDAGPEAPVQEPKLPKPAKKKDAESTMVFWLIGLAAIGLFVSGGF